MINKLFRCICIIIIRYKIVEGVQQRAKKLVPELRDLSYEERLKSLGLTTLKERRTRGDLIEMYKIITGKEKVNVGKFFQMIPSRGDPELSHNKKIFKKRCKTNERGHFFTQRNIDNWNGRGKNVVEAKKTGTFKKRLDKEDSERRRVNENRIFLQYRTR